MEWIRKMYEARESGKGVVIEAFRGSTKTLTMDTFVAFRTGQDPSGSSLIIRASGHAAEEAQQAIADIIEHNFWWKQVFPNIVPDKAKGWSMSGYEVMRTDMDYSEWRRQNASRIDPSIVAREYQSQAIPGMHPSNVLLVDDIHTEENTTSERELGRVRKLLSGTIFPTATVNNPWTVFIGTPWVTNDVLQAVKATDEYVSVRTPAYDAEGKPVWPQGMPENRLERERKQDITGGAEFARMFLLDLQAGQRRVFSYQTYPGHLVNYTWPMYGGCDFASMDDPTKRVSHRSHYALAYVVQLPEGGAVVYDGVLEQWTQLEGEQAVLSAQTMFPSWQHCIVEGDGKGEAFLSILLRNPALRVIGMKTRGKSKADRLTNEMGPWLRSGRVRVSNADTKFLSALRKFLNEYPNVTRDDPGWDAADAVYWALHAMPHVLVMPSQAAELPSLTPRERKPSPWNLSEMRI